MKIGIFLGSFDPIHMGHLNIISTAINYHIVDKILVVPAFRNPWKHTKTPFLTRYLMAERACRIYRSKVEVLDLEQRLAWRLGQNTITTDLSLEYIRRSYPNDEVYIIMTSHTILEIPNWHKGEDILRDNKFIVYNTHDVIDKKGKEFIENHASYLLPLVKLNISSTIIRSMIQKGQTQIYPLVPEAVARIIKKHKLYV